MEVFLQRLFSTFADGWPGIGLFLQRLLTATALMYCGVAQFRATSQFASNVSNVPQMIAAAAGILLLVGLWTPIVGAVVAGVEIWIVFSCAGDPSKPLILATLGATLAMIGPGAWSIDARLFGRKHIETSIR